MTDFTPLAEALQALMQQLAKAQRPSSPDDLLSPKEAAERMGSLGVKAGRFWLEQHGLIHARPGVEFGRHRRTAVELVRWGDVWDAWCREEEVQADAPRRLTVKLGGLG